MPIDNPEEGSAATTHEDGRKTRADRTETLTDYVRHQILEDIIQMRIRPGELVQLASLAEKYAVSRTPVRDALSLLEREGVIKAIAYKGYLVRPIEPGDVHDIFFMRRLLEGPGTEMAAMRLGLEKIEALRHATLPDCDVMTMEYDNVSREFHHTLMEAAGSQRLLSCFEDLYNDVRRLQYAGIGTPRPDLIHQEHMGILDALEKRDGVLARRLMEQHIDSTRSRSLNSWIGGS